jgi:hypothetical protein
MNELVSLCLLYYQLRKPEVLVCIEICGEIRYITLGPHVTFLNFAVRITDCADTLQAAWRMKHIKVLCVQQRYTFPTLVSQNKSQRPASNGLNSIEIEFSVDTEILSSQYLIYMKPVPSLVE